MDDYEGTELLRSGGSGLFANIHIYCVRLRGTESLSLV